MSSVEPSHKLSSQSSGPIQPSHLESQTAKPQQSASHSMESLTNSSVLQLPSIVAYKGQLDQLIGSLNTKLSTHFSQHEQQLIDHYRQLLVTAQKQLYDLRLAVNQDEVRRRMEAKKQQLEAEKRELIKQNQFWSHKCEAVKAKVQKARLQGDQLERQVVFLDHLLRKKAKTVPSQFTNRQIESESQLDQTAQLDHTAQQSSTIQKPISQKAKKKDQLSQQMKQLNQIYSQTKQTHQPILLLNHQPPSIPLNGPTSSLRATILKQLQSRGGGGVNMTVALNTNNQNMMIGKMGSSSSRRIVGKQQLINSTNKGQGSTQKVEPTNNKITTINNKDSNRTLINSETQISMNNNSQPKSNMKAIQQHQSNRSLHTNLPEQIHQSRLQLLFQQTLKLFLDQRKKSNNNGLNGNGLNSNNSMSGLIGTTNKTGNLSQLTDFDKRKLMEDFLGRQDVKRQLWQGLWG